MNGREGGFAGGCRLALVVLVLLAEARWEGLQSRQRGPSHRGRMSSPSALARVLHRSDYRAPH